MYRHFFKRFFDFVLSLIAIILLCPVYLILAILIRIKLGSPVIFKQKRPGRNERIFTLYKFRTMTDEKDAEGNLLADDVRLTAFGAKLRSTSLDELPELFNILKGDMAIVGPRPLLVKYLPYYNERERLRYKVRPGLTGLAQVNGRNSVTWEDRFEIDAIYSESVSALNDLKIIFKTVAVVFKHSDIILNPLEDFDEYRKHQKG